jgi:ABC-type uncharacterized transport system involved in gliding motility auxiliary subunit
MERLKERNIMAGKSKHSRVWSYGSSAVLSSIFFLGILIFLALIAERNPWRVDMTESGAFTLSEQTENILKSLEQTIDIKAFYATASPEQTKAKDVLEIYRYASHKINYEFIDPDRQPEMARRFEVRSYGTLVLEGYGKKQTIQNTDEESVTNAILKLSQNEQKRIYFLVGHGERSIEKADKEGYSTVREALEKENFAVADLNLLQQAQVPDNAAVVIVAGPEKPLFPQEIASLKSYLVSGGRLMVLLDPFRDGGLMEFLKGYGVEVSDDIVIDKLSRVFGGSYLMPVVMQYGHHQTTENFDLATFYPEARSVTPAKEPPEGVQLETLASTSENAWAEKNLDELKSGEVSFDEKEDTLGPIPLIVLAEIDHKQTKPGEPIGTPGKDGQDSAEKEDQKGGNQELLLVAGDSDFASNTYFGLSGNGDLFLNMVNFLAQEKNLITIKPRGKSQQPMLMTQSQAWMVFLVVMVLVPLLVLFSGLAVYRVRRSQR